MKGSARSDKPNYLCQQCGHRSPKWMGFCPQCRAGEALVETSPVTRRVRSHSEVSVVRATDIDATVKDRSATGVGELDRVLGGGLVPGVTILVGGEPGIGKSTLLLQAAESIAASSGSVLIATAEESTHQVQMRARRVGVRSDGVFIASIHDVDDIISLVEERRPHAVIVDSIQTVSSTEIAGSAGGGSSPGP